MVFNPFEHSVQHLNESWTNVGYMFKLLKRALMMRLIV